MNLDETLYSKLNSLFKEKTNSEYLSDSLDTVISDLFERAASGRSGKVYKGHLHPDIISHLSEQGLYVVLVDDEPITSETKTIISWE